MIPLSVPNFEGNEVEYVNDAVIQGWVSTGGAYVDKFEKNIAEYNNVPLAAACQSGTAALHLSLIECGIGYGDMVIVPTLTFIAAVNPVSYVGAHPIFMDCDESLCMDSFKLKEFCENECNFEDGVLKHKKTCQPVKGIIVVHVFGNLADMENIIGIANNYNLKVIEDATEALGSYYKSGRYKGKMAGTIGDFGAFSFNGNKIITTGGGGAVISNNEKAVSHIKYLSTQSKDDAHFYIHNEVGYNYRMTNVQAALGVAQMELLEEFITRKNSNYEEYKNRILDNSNYSIYTFREDIRSNKWLYALLIQIDKYEDDLRAIIGKLQDKGIQTRPIWGLIHEQKPYQNSIAYKIDKAKYYSERILNIPSSTNLKLSEIESVCAAIKELL